MKRGTIVTVVLPGAYGKPRPALVIQSDFFDEHPSLTVLPITSDLRDTPLFPCGSLRRRATACTGNQKS